MDSEPLTRSPTAEQVALNMEGNLEFAMREIVHDLNNTTAAPLASIDMIVRYELKHLYVQREVIRAYLDHAKASVDSAAHQISNVARIIQRRQNAQQENIHLYPGETLSTLAQLFRDVRASAHDARRDLGEAKRIHESHPYHQGYESFQDDFERALMGLSQTVRLATIAEEASSKGHLPYNPERTSLNRSIEDPVMMYTSKLKKALIGIETTTEMHLGKPLEFHFMGCYTRMFQVMINILSNMLAVLRGRENPLIKVDIHRHPDWEGYAQVCVINNGPPVKEPERMFEYGRSGTGSSGLGLPICRKIVGERFGGKIYTGNLSDRKGLAYYIDLPVID